MQFANNAYRAKTDSLSETSVENIILRCLRELVRSDGWYEFDQIHQNLVSFIREQGLDVGALTKKRLGKLMHDLELVERKTAAW